MANENMNEMMPGSSSRRRHHNDPVVRVRRTQSQVIQDNALGQSAVTSALISQERSGSDSRVRASRAWEPSHYPQSYHQEVDYLVLRGQLEPPVTIREGSGFDLHPMQGPTLFIPQYQPSDLFHSPSDSFHQSSDSFHQSSDSFHHISPEDIHFPLDPQTPITPSTSNYTSNPRLSKSDRLRAAYDILRGGDRSLSPIDLMLEVLDRSNMFYTQCRQSLFSTHQDKLIEMLDAIAGSKAGKELLQEWFQPHALKQVVATVGREMNAVKDVLGTPSGSQELDYDFICNWAEEDILGKLEDSAPTLYSFLSKTCQTATSEKNKIKTHDTVCQIIIAQLSYQRSNRNTRFHAIFGLFLWATGCSRQTIDSLYQCGLSMSYSGILNLIKYTANEAIKTAIQVSRQPHLLAYDNVNLATSIHTEQRGTTTPGKVQSGTYSVIYPLRNAALEDMLLAPITLRLRSLPELRYAHDLRPTSEQIQSFFNQLQLDIIDILFLYCPEFNSYKSKPEFIHPLRRAIPPNHKTLQYPLRLSTLEEASIQGNLAVHEDIYINQLKFDPNDLNKYAIPSINDQSTNARIRSARAARRHDLSEWSRRDVFQLGFGLFHLCLNLVWALLHTHRGTIKNIGSLSYFFTLMEKTRLGGHHPDYHALLSALTQILHGLILNGWRRECGYSSLENFAKSGPNPSSLLQKAAHILHQYATVKVPSPSPANTKPSTDPISNNITLLTRDLLYLTELIRAIAFGDFGCIEDFLPHLAMMFRGAGSNNYCYEILYFILHLKHIWPPGFANIMRDNMLINISGHAGQAMPVDLNIEHLIGYIKSLIVAKGLYSTWEYMGDASACIVQLQHIKKEVNLALHSSYQGSIHTTPDTSELVFRVADKAQELSLQEVKTDRTSGVLVKDIILDGQKKLCSSTLSTFNKKARHIFLGLRGVDETATDGETSEDEDGDGNVIDEIPLPDFNMDTSTELDE